MNDIEPLEPIEAKEPEQASVYIEKILDRLGIDPEKESNIIAVSWPIIVPEYASMSRCAGVKDGKLLIKVTHPSKISLLKLNSREIMKKIKAFSPDSGITGLVFTLDQKNR